MRNGKRWAFEPNAGRVDGIIDADDLIADCPGYSSGTLDAQRENNRLTCEANRLFMDMSRSIGNLSGGSQAAFG
jgi:hypothetical protein